MPLLVLVVDVVDVAAAFQVRFIYNFLGFYAFVARQCQTLVKGEVQLKLHVAWLLCHCYMLIVFVVALLLPLLPLPLKLFVAIESQRP